MVIINTQGLKLESWPKDLEFGLGTEGSLSLLDLREWKGFYVVRNEGERDVVVKMYLLSAVYCTSHTEASLKYITSRTNRHWRTGERERQRQTERDRNVMVKISLF